MRTIRRRPFLVSIRSNHRLLPPPRARLATHCDGILPGMMLVRCHAGNPIDAAYGSVSPPPLRRFAAGGHHLCGSRKRSSHAPWYQPVQRLILRYQYEKAVLRSYAVAEMGNSAKLTAYIGGSGTTPCGCTRLRTSATAQHAARCGGL